VNGGLSTTGSSNLLDGNEFCHSTLDVTGGLDVRAESPVFFELIDSSTSFVRGLHAPDSRGNPL